MAKTFRDLIADNKRNSFLLVVGFCLFVALVTFVLSLAAISYLAGDADALGHALAVSALAVGAALAISFYAYYAGGEFILGVSGAKPLEKRDDPQLYNVVEELAIAAGVPMPQIYLIHDAAPNAFATGRDPQHAVVAITSGLRTKLNREELQGVMAHELAHIRNFDIRLMLLLAVLVGTVVMLADLYLQFLRHTPQPRSDSSDRKDSKGGAFVLIVMLLALVLALIAPMLAQLIQLAVSRQREYLADASAVEFTRNPQGLASALRKIDADPAQLRNANRGTAHLYIANPIKKYAELANTLFASHPPMHERIARLEALSGRSPAREL